MKDISLKTIRKQWTKYEDLVSSKIIAQKLALPQQLFPETIQHLVPSIELASDGPVVRGVFIFGDEYIGEVRLTKDAEEFDFMLKNTISNYRVELGTHNVVKNSAAIELAKSKGVEPPNPDVVIYEKAEIIFVHIWEDTSSELFYFGPERDAWLQTVVSIIPVTVLKDSL